MATKYISYASLLSLYTHCMALIRYLERALYENIATLKKKQLINNLSSSSACTLYPESTLSLVAKSLWSFDSRLSEFHTWRTQREAW